MRRKVLGYALQKYGTNPEYLFESSPDTAVLRHSEGRKWYGIIMTVPYSRLGLRREGSADILNLKCDPIISGSIIAEGKAFPAYHMNKEKWISLLLDGSVSESEIYPLVDLSFALTAKVKKTKTSPKTTE